MRLFPTLFLATLFLAAPTLSAQQSDTKIFRLNGNASVRGIVIDSESGKIVPQAAIQLYTLPDTVSVHGTTSDNSGRFTISKLPIGNYMFRFSFLGYVTRDTLVSVARRDRDIDLGRVVMCSDAIMLSEAVVEAQLPEMQVVDDTVVYNASAFRVAEGSVLEELIKKLPGVILEEDGTLTVNGKTVTRIMVDGKEWFGTDKQMALKNLPVEMVDKVKTYERKSDLARVTGIDDGEEETVMDLQVKPNMRKGWISNIDLAGGSPVGSNDYGDWVKALYSGRLTVNRFENNQQYSLTANHGNAGGGGGGGGAGNGLSYSTQSGLNFAKNIGRAYSGRRNEYPLEIGGNVRYNGSSSQSKSETESERFMTNTTSQSFSNSYSSNSSHRGGVNGEFRIEWRPDTTTDIIFRPTVSFTTSGNGSERESATFSQDPHLYMDNILGEYRTRGTLMDSIGVNSQISSSESDNRQFQFGAQLQFNKKLSYNGRNFTATLNYSYSGSSGNNYTKTDQTYYQDHRRDTIMNRYNKSPSVNRSVNTRVMWSEPLKVDRGKGVASYLQVSYQFQYRFQDQDRCTYQFPSTLYPNWQDSWELPDPNLMDLYLKDSLSTYQTYENFDHTIDVQLRRTSNNSNFNFGVSLHPQHSLMKYDHMGVHADTARTVFNWNPTANFRYRFTRQKSLNFTYRGSSSQPGMTDLLNIRDNSNPLNITIGNPGLEPTFNNNFSIQYQTNIQEKMRSYNFNVSLGNTLRSISNKTTYDEETGVTTSQRVNMEGFWSNWNASGNITFNTQYGEKASNRLTITSQTQGSFRHQEGYMRSRAMTANAGSQISTTETTTASERVTLRYSHEWLELTLQGNVSYNHSRNNLQASGNLDTWNFNYGPNIQLIFSNWHNFRISSNMNMRQRRGYSSSDYNTDEFIWNVSAQISLFKRNAGTLSIQWNDILNQESNISRNVSTTGRSDSRNNTIHSYVMAHFVYRINVFGNREVRQNMRNAGRMGMQGGGMGGSRGGGMGGGYGGGYGGGGGNRGGGFGGGGR